MFLFQIFGHILGEVTLFKDINRQISQQTREGLGFVQTDNSRGYKYTGSKPDQSGQNPIDIPNFTWTYMYYVFNRNITVNGYVYKNAVPVLDHDIYAHSYPLIYDYLVFWYDYWIYTGTPRYREKIEGGETGKITSINLKAYGNHAFGTTLKGSGYKENVSLRFVNNSTNKMGVSIWCREHISNVDSYGNSLITHLLYSSGRWGFTGSTVVDIPIGTCGSDIYILCYCGENNDTEAQNISIDADFTKRQKISGIPSLDTPAINAPAWGVTPIITTSDPVSGNVINQINFQNSFTNDWDSVRVFRRKTNDTTLKSYAINKRFYNNIFVDIATSNAVVSGNSIEIANNLEKIKGTLTGYPNYIKNADFSWYSGNLISNWSTKSTSTGALQYYAATSYPYFGDCIYGGNSLKMQSYKTSSTKSHYIETEYIALNDTSKSLSFWYKVKGSSTAKLKIMEYSSTDGTIVDSALYGNLYDFSDIYGDTADEIGKNWYRFTGKFNAEANTNDAGSALYLDTSTDYVKVRFYSSYQATSASTYLIDGFYLGTANGDFIYDTTQSTRVAIQLYDSFEFPRTQMTSFNSYFQSTSKSTSNAIYASSVFGQPQYVTSVNWNPKYDYGVKFVDTAANYLANGDFMGGGRFWSSSKGFNWSTVRGTSPYSSLYARFTGHTAYSYIGQSTTKPGSIPILAANNQWSFAVWAKSEIAYQPLRLYLSTNTATKVSSADFELSTTWSKYQLSTTFSNGGNTIKTRIIVPENNYYQIDIAGAQLEKCKNIVDFNLSTVQGNTRAIQGMRYDDLLSSAFGTVRMWYTPLLSYSDYRYSTALIATQYRGLLYYGTSTNFKSLYWKNGDFVFEQRNGANDYKCLIHPFHSDSSGAYKPVANFTDEPVHIVATWDTSKAHLYINGYQSTASLVVSTCGRRYRKLYLGCKSPNVTTAYCANGIISDFRIDKNTWGEDDVIADYNATRRLYPDNSVIKINEDQFIGEKQIQDNDLNICFIDDNGLEHNSEYNYVLCAVDNFGNQSDFSEVQSIKTKRKQYEYEYENKVPNSSFEFVDYSDGTPLYWSSAGITPEVVQLATAYHFRGTRSAVVFKWPAFGYDGFIESDYLSVGSTSIPYYLSCYGYRIGGFEFGLEFYNYKYEKQGERYYTKANTTTSGAFGNDGNWWTRFSTCFSKNNITYSTVMATRFWKVKFTCNGAAMAFVDCVQLEPYELRSYREGFMVGAGNLGANSIDGNAVAFNTLVGRHFYAGEISISGHSSDANRLLIGREGTANSYAELKADYFKWHSPNTPTAVGWNYTKHVESGWAKFGDRVEFSQPYCYWNACTATPILMITPYNTLTYTTANTTKPQRLTITKSCSSNAFVVNAKLYAEFCDETYQNLINFNGYYYYPGVGFWQSDGIVDSGVAYNGTDDVEDDCNYALTTVLAHTSRSQYGTLTYTLINPDPKGFNEFSVNINLFASSQSTRDFDTSAGKWRLLQSDFYRYVGYPERIDYTMNINNSWFATTRSIAIRALMPAREPASYRINPISLSYTPDYQTLLKSDSAIGSYNWIAIDGGVIG